MTSQSEWQIDAYAESASISRDLFRDVAEALQTGDEASRLHVLLHLVAAVPTHWLDGMRFVEPRRPWWRRRPRWARLH